MYVDFHLAAWYISSTSWYIIFICREYTTNCLVYINRLCLMRWIVYVLFYGYVRHVIRLVLDDR